MFLVIRISFRYHFFTPSLNFGKSKDKNNAPDIPRIIFKKIEKELLNDLKTDEEKLTKIEFNPPPTSFPFASPILSIKLSKE